MGDKDLPEELRILVRQLGFQAAPTTLDQSTPPPEETPPEEEPPEETPSPTPTPTPAPSETPVATAGGGGFIPPPTRGSYVLDEEDLVEEDKRLLHGRAFVVDRDTITEISSGSARTYYVAYDQVQGLVVPGRSLAVENNGDGSLHYRWTDDGDKWTAWITLEEGGAHDYRVDEKVRFAEIQVYADTSGSIISMIATR